MLTTANLYETAKAEQRENLARRRLEDTPELGFLRRGPLQRRDACRGIAKTAKGYSTSVTTPSDRSSLPQPGAEVVAIGTRFRVRLADGEVTVTVLEGAVAVFNDASATDPTSSERETTLLYPNDQVTLNDHGATAVWNPSTR